MNFEVELEEYQLRIIKERLKFNFFEELKKTNPGKQAFKKSFRNELDILIPQLYNKGVQFYALTIDLTYLKSYDLPKDFWADLHEEVEHWVAVIAKNVSMVEFCYFSIEMHPGKNKSKESFSSKMLSIIDNKNSLEGLPHLHGVLGVRSLIGYNEQLDLSIKKLFCSIYKINDIVIKPLLTKKAIKAYWNYCIKENNFKFHRFAHYSEYNSFLYGSIAQLELIYDEQERYAFGMCEHRTSKTRSISGVQVRHPNNKTLITYLLNLFMWHKNYKLHNNNLYCMIPDTKYSWAKIDTLDSLRLNSIQIFEFLKTLYPQHLEDLNPMEFIFQDWDKFIEFVHKNNQYLPGIKFKEDAMEFLDGVYFINENKFYFFSKNTEILGKKMFGFNCCVFFKKSYHHLKSPATWLKSLQNNLNEEFFVDLARYFHSEPLENLKQKSLVIVGKSNTGKTTLISNVISNLFGKENIGLIGKGDNFILEQLENKKVIIADEFKYSKSSRSSILKLMNNELDLINKKGEQKKLFQNKAPILFMFNPETNQEMLEDIAFKNRFKRYDFSQEIQNWIPKIDELIKLELPEIIIYCNRLYFKDKNKKLISGNVEKTPFLT